MKQSESIKELATAMAAAQGEMGSAIKGASNPFFKSKYADLGSVIQAIKAPFAAHGLSYVQFPITGDNSVGVITRLMHSSGEWLEQEYFIPLGKMDAQSVGSVCLTQDAIVCKPSQESPLRMMMAMLQHRLSLSQ
jgi:hypothetical protein